MATVRGMGHWHANGAFDLVALAAVDQGRGGLVYDRTYVYEAATVVGRCVHVAASGPGRWVRSRGLGPVFDRADGGVGGGGGLGPVFDRADGGSERQPVALRRGADCSCGYRATDCPVGDD